MPARVGAGDVGAQRIADREDALLVGDAEQLERGLVDIGQRLAVPAHRAAELLVALRDRAGADEQLVADRPRPDRDWRRPSAGRAAAPLAASARNPRSFVLAAGPGVEDEIGVLRPTRRGEVEALEHVVVARRPDVIAGACRARRRTGRRAAADAARSPRPRNGRDRRAAAGCRSRSCACRPACARRGALESTHARACRASRNCAQRVERAGHRLVAVMQHAPEIEDEAVIARDDLAQAAENAASSLRCARSVDGIALPDRLGDRGEAVARQQRVELVLDARRPGPGPSIDQRGIELHQAGAGADLGIGVGAATKCRRRR